MPDRSDGLLRVRRNYRAREVLRPACRVGYQAGGIVLAKRSEPAGREQTPEPEISSETGGQGWLASRCAPPESAGGGASWCGPSWVALSLQPVNMVGGLQRARHPALAGPPSPRTPGGKGRWEDPPVRVSWDRKDRAGSPTLEPAVG